MHKIQKPLALGLLLAMCLILVACHSDGALPAGESPAVPKDVIRMARRTRIVDVARGWLSRREPEQAVRLTWWITYAPDSAEYPTFQALAEAYTERTGTVIDLVSVPWDDIAPRGVANRLSLALDADPRSRERGPDVWGPVPSTWIGPYATQGQVLALEPGQVRDATQYADVAMLASQWAGVQYAMPVLMDSVALIYNRELVPDPPQSFEELVEIARELTDAETGRWGLVLPLLSQVHTYPFIDGYGGYIMRCEASLPEDQPCDVKDVGLNNEGSVRGIELLSNLYLKERLFPEALADRAVMHDEALRLFVQGQAGMLIDGPWVISRTVNSGIQYGISTIPDLPEGTRSPRSLTTVHVLAASAYSAYPAAAIEFMNDLTSPEAVMSLLDTLGKAPVRRDVLRQPVLRDDRERRARLEAWYNCAANGVLLPQAPELGYVWAPWARALDEAIPGLKPAQEALDQAVEQIVSYIEPD